MAPVKNYTPEQMEKAVEAVRNGEKVAAAAKRFGVPRITLHDKITGKTSIGCAMGPSTVLTKSEEDVLERWLIALSEKHIPVSKDALLDSVQKIISDQNRINPFTNNRPSKKWFQSFLKRHPNLTQRVPDNLSRARDNVSEDNIRSWFKEIESYFDENGLKPILNCPERLFNADESAFFLSPKPGRVLTKKGDKHPYSSCGDEKENLTVLITGNAAGDLAPPMIIFSYDRIPSNIAASVPDEWAIGKSESGWMCSSTFFEYITNVFSPWLDQNNIEKPIIFFVDGHKSHVTLHLSNFCSQNGIEVIALYPNSTHILQPMDLSVFRPLKGHWKKAVTQWKMENLGQNLRKENFAPVLQKALTNLTKDCVKNGFRAGGLFPFGPDYIDMSKIKQQEQESLTKTNLAQTEFVKYLENEIVNVFSVQKLDQFNKLYFENRSTMESNISNEDVGLYLIWAKNKSEDAIHHLNSSDAPSTSGTLKEVSKSLEDAAIGVTRDVPVAKTVTFGHRTPPSESLPSTIPPRVIRELSQEPSSNTRIDTVLNQHRPPPQSGDQLPQQAKNYTKVDTMLNQLLPLPEVSIPANVPNATAPNNNNNNTTVNALLEQTLSPPSSSTNLPKETDHIPQHAKNNTKAYTTINQLFPLSEISSHLKEDHLPEQLNNNTTVGALTVPTLRPPEFSSSYLQEITENRLSEDLIVSTTVIQDATPQKKSLDSVLGVTVPSPFKRSLFWPESLASNRKRIKRERIPSTITSKAWKEYHEKKETEKNQKQQEKEERARLRIEKKKLKEQLTNDKKNKSKTKLKKKKLVQEESTSESDAEISYAESDNSYNIEDDEDKEAKKAEVKTNKQLVPDSVESDSENLPLSKLTSSKATKSKKGRKYSVGNFVIIKYEGEYFPGKIASLGENAFEISTMTLTTGNAFKWPNPPDKIFYGHEEIIEEIKEPICLNKRGFYRIPEMDKYLPHIYDL